MGDATASKLERFNKWCADNGISMNEGCELRDCGDACGFGLFAKSYIRVNEAILEVPRNMMITADLIAQMPDYNQILAQHFEDIKLDPFVVLCMFFYLETAKSDSMWKPYLDMLPQRFTTPLFSHPDLSQIPAEARGQIEKQQAEIVSIKAKLVVFFPDLDEDRFKWAWHVVNSRCIYCENPPHHLLDPDVKNNLAVVPLQDMSNHQSEAQCSPGFDKYKQCYRVTAAKGVMEGEQLFLCYGAHENSKLWIDYGFTLEDNLFNKVEIGIDLLLALATKVGFKLDRKNEEIAREAAFPCTLYASDNKVGYGIINTCIILSLSRAQLKTWQIHVYERQNDNTGNVIENAEQLANKILKELSNRLQAKMAAAKPEYQWLWSDQIKVIESVLQTE